MKNFIITLSGALFLLAAILLPMSALAQEDVAGTSVDTTSDVILEESFDGVEIQEPEEIPSVFGLFWRNVKEQVSLITTFDPVEKAEKQVKFAEERMRIAEKMATESADPEVQARAEKMVERAKVLFEKVEAKREKWVEKDGERVGRLLENVAAHQDSRERILDHLEEVLPEGVADQIRDHRVEMLQKSERLLNAIENENVPENVREHLKEVKERIEEHAQEVREFQEKRRELMDALKDGDEEATEQLKELREGRHERVQERQEMRKEEVSQNFERTKKRLEAAAENGDENAVGALKSLEKEQFEDLQEHRQMDRPKSVEPIRAELRVEHNDEYLAPVQPKPLEQKPMLRRDGEKYREMRIDMMEEYDKEDEYKEQEDDEVDSTVEKQEDEYEDDIAEEDSKDSGKEQ